MNNLHKTLLTIEFPVAQWLEHPPRTWKLMSLNPICDSDFFKDNSLLS